MLQKYLNVSKKNRKERKITCQEQIMKLFPQLPEYCNETSRVSQMKVDINLETQFQPIIKKVLKFFCAATYKICKVYKFHRSYTELHKRS